MGHLTQLLHRSDPRDRSDIYQHLGLELRYESENCLVVAQIGAENSCAKNSVRGGTPALSTWPGLSSELVLG